MVDASLFGEITMLDGYIIKGMMGMEVYCRYGIKKPLAVNITWWAKVLL